MRNFNSSSSFYDFVLRSQNFLAERVVVLVESLSGLILAEKVGRRTSREPPATNFRKCAMNAFGSPSSLRKHSHSGFTAVIRTIEKTPFRKFFFEINAWKEGRCMLIHLCGTKTIRHQPKLKETAKEGRQRDEKSFKQKPAGCLSLVLAYEPQHS